MAQVLHSLNDEWATIADSPMARRALMRWSDVHPVLLPAGNLAEVIELGYRPDIGPEIRRALALMAPEDHLAARTLLQELLGGLVNLARRVGRDGDAVDDDLHPVPPPAVDIGSRVEGMDLAVDPHADIARGPHFVPERFILLADPDLEGRHQERRRARRLRHHLGDDLVG